MVRVKKKRTKEVQAKTEAVSIETVQEVLDQWLDADSSETRPKVASLKELKARPVHTYTITGEQDKVDLSHETDPIHIRLANHEVEPVSMAIKQVKGPRVSLTIPVCCFGEVKWIEFCAQTRVEHVKVERCRLCESGDLYLQMKAPYIGDKLVLPYCKGIDLTGVYYSIAALLLSPIFKDRIVEFGDLEYIDATGIRALSKDSLKKLSIDMCGKDYTPKYTYPKLRRLRLLRCGSIKLNLGDFPELTHLEVELVKGELWLSDLQYSKKCRLKKLVLINRYSAVIDLPGLECLELRTESTGQRDYYTGGPDGRPSQEAPALPDDCEASLELVCKPKYLLYNNHKITLEETG
uniref:Uncharacterized protein n=1 Tax=viral metagenome TaxID=1070528 RepID=A0A6C0JUG5_9ZZZZ